MTLKHDAQGFLVGDPIDLNRLMSDWTVIRRDVRAIRDVVLGTKNRAERTKPEPRVAVQVPADRNTRTETVVPSVRNRAANSTDRTKIESAVVNVPSRNRSGKQITVRLHDNVPASIRTPLKPMRRDIRGRFARESSASGKDGTSGNFHGSLAEDTGLINSVSERIAGALKEAGSSLEDSDPAVKAMTEVAQPLARGYEILTGGNSQKKQEGWLRRIWTSLTGFRKDEKVFNKAAQKSLKNIEEKPDASESGGPSMSGALFGVMGRLLTRIPIVRGLFGAGGNLLKSAGGLLKRIPLLGALLSIGGAAVDIYGSENDDTLSRREKDRIAGKAIGGAGGAIGGMMAGMKLGSLAGAIGGPIGVAIGGVVGGAAGMFFGDRAGQVLGDTFGGWVNELRASDIPGTIRSVWNEIKVTVFGTFDWIKSGWDSAVSGLKQAWKDTTDTFKEVGESLSVAWENATGSIGNVLKAVGSIITGAYELLRNMPVIGSAVRATEDTVKKTAEVASELKDKAVEKAGQAVDTAMTGAEKAWETTKTITASVVPQGLKDSISRRRNRQALENQMVAAGITDSNEQAMFMAQMEHESGGFTKMEESFNYRSADRLMAVSASARKHGKASVEAAMAQGPEAVAELMYGGRMGNTEKGDAYKFRGRGHIQLTGKDNYAAAGKALGLDLLSNPELAADPEIASRIATWYWKSNPKLAVAGKAGDVEAVTRAINGGRNGIEHRKELFAKYRTEGVPATAVAMASAPAAQAVVPAAPIVASSLVPGVQVAPSSPAVTEAPPVQVPMSSPDSRQPVTVVTAAADVSQDLRERSIAHIVTGGLGQG